MKTKLAVASMIFAINGCAEPAALWACWDDSTISFVSRAIDASICESWSGKQDRRIFDDLIAQTHKIEMRAEKLGLGPLPWEELWQARLARADQFPTECDVGQVKSGKKFTISARKYFEEFSVGLNRQLDNIEKKGKMAPCW